MLSKGQRYASSYKSGWGGVSAVIQRFTHQLSGAGRGGLRIQRKEVLNRVSNAAIRLREQKLNLEFSKMENIGDRKSVV